MASLLGGSVAGCAGCAARDAVIAAQGRANATLAGRVAELEAANAQLLERVERVERLVSRNSGNSSFPPSMDDQPGHTPPRKPGRTRGKRKPGGQRGSPGTHLAWSDDPDETIPHFPDGTCECGAALSGAADLGVAASHQQVEIPLASATVTQHDLHAVACGCGKVHRAARPEGITGGPGTVNYGPALQALCVFLMVAHAIPVHRCAELIESLTGAKPSPGFVHGMLARAAAAVADTNKAIRALIILAHVVCADETPIRVGPGPKSRKRRLLVACTRLLTFYFLGDRSMATFRAFVLPDMTGVIVHDRYQNYDSAEFPGLIHQLCGQHLLRDLADAAERYPAARGQDLSAVPEQISAPLIHTFRHGVLAGLSEIARRPGRKQRPCRDLLECLRDRQADVLRFVSDLRIPPTSNDAERDLRPAGQDPAEDLGAAALRGNHPVPVRDPRLPLHRRQAWRRRADRPARCDYREPMDATHPGVRLTRRTSARHAARSESTESHRYRCFTLAFAGTALLPMVRRDGMSDRVPGEFAAYSLAWSEEFDGAAGSLASPRTWRPEVGGHGWGNQELQCYTDGTGNAALDGAGNLAIVVRRPDPQLAGRQYGGCEYSSARLISKDLMSFRYGLVRARIKLPRGRGIWPGFWLLGENIDEVGWPHCGEIDVMENFGTNPAVVHGTVHGPGYSGGRGITAALDVGSPLADDFHVYSVSWEPDRIRWYADEKLYHTVTRADLRGNPWVFDHDFFLLVNVAVGGRFSERPDRSAAFPQRMLVDYIRVYAA